MREMTPEEREGFFAEAKKLMVELHKTARDEIEEGKEIPAMMYVLKETGDVSLVMLQDAMNTDKDIAAMLIKSIQSTPGVLATVYMCEAWMVEMDASEEIDVLPSKHPKRFEAVIWVVETVVGDVFARAVISRNPDRLADLELPKFDPETPKTCSGRFVGGFKQQRAEWYQRRGNAVLKSDIPNSTNRGKA